MLALKSANDGNDDEVNAENDDAPGALNSSTKSVSAMLAF